jgi:hypothetical protein
LNECCFLLFTIINLKKKKKKEGFIVQGCLVTKDIKKQIEKADQTSRETFEKRLENAN